MRGLAKWFGFELPRNFRFPYLATSVPDFWRRWHVSLSAWLRDYVYVPLGGSRGGELRTYRNLLVVFVACGLWLAQRSPTYEATAEILVTPLPQDDPTFQGLPFLRDYGEATRTIQTAATLESRYPDWDAFQAVRRRLDPDGVFANDYTERVLGPTA